MADSTRLYELLPATYRELDEESGHALRALLGLISSQADVVRSDIARLWDDFFIETCDRWVIAYLGDLVGNNLLNDTHRRSTPDTARELFPDLVGKDLRPPLAIRLRADVAKTVYYRRRKGTLPMLEEMARDVTGWPVHAVEFFELLGWTQFVRNHLRMHNLRSPDIRRIEPMDRLDGPFDHIAHTADVRPIGQLNGWHNIKNIGFFLWRLNAHPITRVTAGKASVPWGFHFSPLGNPAPLFSRWRREGDESGLATELHVPGPIRPAFFYDDLERYEEVGPGRPDFTDLYGMFDPIDGVDMDVSPEASFFIALDGKPIHPAVNPASPAGDSYEPGIVCRNLNPWPADQPPGKAVAVDVSNGRVAVGTEVSGFESIDVWYHSGFPADLGGGPYERGRWLVRPELANLNLVVQQSQEVQGSFASVSDALLEWANMEKPNTIITILDNRSYPEPLSIELEDDHWLIIEAANGARPHVVLDGGLQVTGDHPGSELTLSGLLIEGWIALTGDTRRLRLIHTTLVPGRALTEDGDPATSDPSIVASATANGEPINANLRVEIAFSVTGPIGIPEHAGLWLLDSVVDGVGGMAIGGPSLDDVGPGATANFERTTVLGASYSKNVAYASESIFTGRVDAERRQDGCMRFCFVPRGSASPRRYRCQPDLEITAQIEEAERKAQEAQETLTPELREAIRKEIVGWLKPSFTSTQYGQPAYSQLHLSCPVQIRRGAEDGSEMGVYCHLKQPQREGNLRMRLDEYLPFGLEPGFIYVT